MADIVPIPQRGIADIPGVKQVGLLIGVAAAVAAATAAATPTSNPTCFTPGMSAMPRGGMGTMSAMD